MSTVIKSTVAKVVMVKVVMVKVVVLYVAVSASACAEVADLVWAENSADQHSIIISHWDGDVWSEPNIVYEGDHFVAAPALASRKDGSKLVIWTEQQTKQHNTVLMQSNCVNRCNSWAEGMLFSRFGIENVAPSIVVDKLNHVWVFWSAHKGALSDIYFSKNQSGAWSEPVKANKQNEVPDLLPIAQINADGHVEVKWQTYRVEALQYVEEIKVFKVADTLINADNKRADKELNPVNIALPSFLPRNSIGTLHFPDNRYVQSIRLESLR